MAFDGSGGKRPFVVVSRAELNRGDYFVAVPLTSQNLAIRRNLPNCVFLAKGSFGLPKDCVAQAEALTQLRRTDLAIPVERLGVLSDDAHRQLLSALGNVLGADCGPAPAVAIPSAQSNSAPRGRGQVPPK